MRALDRLIELSELLFWVATESTNAQIKARIVAKLEELDLRVCPECGKLYLHMTHERHYRCGTCRWKRRLIRENAAE